MGFANYEAMSLSTMIARVQKYHPGDGYKLVEIAWYYAEKAHDGQVRKSGEPYFIHPCFVASILTRAFCMIQWKTVKESPRKL